MDQLISLITLSHRRDKQLVNLIKGVNKSTLLPGELILVLMNQAEVPELPESSFPVKVVHLNDEESPIPLAKARNLGAAEAKYPNLLFLDVDCIPSTELIQSLTNAVHKYPGIHMGHVRYTQSGFWEKEIIDDEHLMETTEGSPIREELEFPVIYQTMEYSLFWSLCFIIPRRHFNLIGGFDEQIIGYGGEDTDFGFTARNLSVSLYSTPAICYHQWHKESGTPVNHLETIVQNANYLYKKWGVWIMEGWLEDFQRLGLVTFSNNQFTLA